MSAGGIIEGGMEVLEIGAEKAIEFDRQTLKRQGHRDTGALDRSLKYRIGFRGSYIEIEFLGKEYGRYVSTGIRPSRVRYSVNHVIGWARRKKPGVSDKEVMGFIYAMMRAHKREGIPTKASSRFSENGDRLGWIDLGSDYIDENFEELFLFERIIERVLDDSLSPLLVGAK